MEYFMKKIFFLLLFLSISGVAGTYVWKTWFRESQGSKMTSVNPAGERSSRFAARAHREDRASPRRPSERQDMMFNLATISSIFSMIGTALSLFFAYRADRHSVRPAPKE